MLISREELDKIIKEEIVAAVDEGALSTMGIRTPWEAIRAKVNRGKQGYLGWKGDINKWLDKPAPAGTGREEPATPTTDEPTTPTTDEPTVAPTATDTTKKSNIKHTLPNNFRAKLEGRMQEVYSELARAHEKQYPGKDFRKDLIELVKLLGPHNPMMDVRKLDESNRLGRVLKMVAKINGGGGRDSENAFKSLGALKNADKNGGVSRVIHAMLMYRGRKGGEHQIGNDLSQFVGALMNAAQAVDISGRKSVQ